MNEKGANGTSSRQRRPTNIHDEESGTTGSSPQTAGRRIDFNSHQERHHSLVPDTQGLARFWARFTRKGKKNIGLLESLKAIASSSWLNTFVVFIPLAWVSHFKFNEVTTFVLCFLAIVPMEQLFEWGGEQMALYTGQQLGDLIIITLNNAVEATLAIMLLEKQRCDLRLLQSTIVGVVVLHLLLIPGTAWITGGARIWEQNLHPHTTALNHTLLTIGVMSLLLPAAFFSALDRGNATSAAVGTAESLVNDHTRDIFLRMSRGIAILLLLVYFASRIFLHNPPGEDNALTLHPDAPDALKHEEQRLANTEPEVNQYICILMLLSAIAIVAVTAEFLVESIELVRESGKIEESWFGKSTRLLTDIALTFPCLLGLILLPLASYSADGAVAILFFIRYMTQIFFGTPPPPVTLAKARAIDLSIQFLNFWMPFLVLLAWWSDKPFHLLFDQFEVALLLGACFLVNYVTADALTNWAEGVCLVVFYIMIAVCSWFYPGQESIRMMLSCTSILQAAAGAGAGEEH